MTAVIHHGPPGSYKTFTLVQNVLINALADGRLVITNIRGFNSLENIKAALGVEFPSSSQIWYIEPDDAGFKTMSTFFHWAPAGALIAMDEGQRIYPTRSRRFDDLDLHSDIAIRDADDTVLLDSETGQAIYRPKTVENAFDQHRHFNWDIYISTPNISKIHKEIRHVVEWAYRHRNNSGLLPWFKNTWTEFRHDPETNGKSVSHYSGSPKRYKADQKYFSCYQSTATGTAQQSSENISIFRDTKLRLLFGLIVVCVSYLGYQLHAAFNRVEAKTNAASASATAAPAKKTDNVVSDVGVSVDNHKAVDSQSSDPLEGGKFFYTGSINSQLLFEVQVGDMVLPLNYDDLRSFGYYVSRKTVAYIALQRGDKVIYAFNRPRAPIDRVSEPVERYRGQLGAVTDLIASQAL